MSVYLLCIFSLLSCANGFIGNMMSSWGKVHSHSSQNQNQNQNTRTIEQGVNMNHVTLASRGLAASGNPVNDCYRALQNSVNSHHCLRACSSVSYSSNSSSACKRAGLHLDQGDAARRADTLIKCVVLNDSRCWLFHGQY
eukprot:GHVH01012064.1.p1 GENE.GHVH01012064.1~~GHVH01012064.1.p1  ORF type:complete len:140 (+),score=4.85 GHVH01012064.1:100-519(+)